MHLFCITVIQREKYLDGAASDDGINQSASAASPRYGSNHHLSLSWPFSLRLISNVNKRQEEEMGIDTFNLDTGTLNNFRYWGWHPVLVWHLPQCNANAGCAWIISFFDLFLTQGYSLTSAWSGQELFRIVTWTIVTSPICIRHSRPLLKSLWSSSYVFFFFLNLSKHSL